MKKGMGFLLCLTLLCTGLSAGAERAMDELHIGSPTQLSGDFFTDMWGNNTADMDVRELIHGYSTVSFSGEGNYVLDGSVLKDVQLTDDKKGNRTYLFTLQDSLTYCDGSELTAKDYVFSALLLADPRMTDLGGVPGSMAHLVGFDKYVEDVRAESAEACFSGVRLISDQQFSVTVSKGFLPYYYELTLANVRPYPMGVLAPGCDVADDGKGAYITGPFTTEMLKKTVLDESTGYRYCPKVTSGPYILDSYDPQTHRAELRINPYYIGNFEGQKPEIQKLTLQMVSKDNLMESLQSGEIDLVNKLSSGKQINQGLTLAREGELSSSNYLRTGLSFVGFACEAGLTQNGNIRKAIAMCLDEQELVDEYLQGYGLVTYGFYGYGQWMAAQMGDSVLELSQYSFNPNAAIGLLEEDGWVLGEDGLPYNDEVGGIRFRKAEDGTLEKLSVRMAIPDNSDAGKTVGEMLGSGMAQVGFELNVSALPYPELLKHYYRQVDRGYDLFFGGTNFNLVFDPYYTFSTAPLYQGVFNTTGIQDEKLMQLADEMRKTAPGDQVDYQEKWFKFQQRFVEVLPLVPLYSNVYFDFFRPDLQNYLPNANWSFANALLYAYLGEPRVQETELTQGGDGANAPDGAVEQVGEDEMVILD